MNFINFPFCRVLIIRVSQSKCHRLFQRCRPLLLLLFRRNFFAIHLLLKNVGFIFAGLLDFRRHTRRGRERVTQWSEDASRHTSDAHTPAV